MTTKQPPELPEGSPPGAVARRAAEVPAGTWIAPFEEAMNPDSWRPALDRWNGLEYTTFFHAPPSAGQAQAHSKFPPRVFIAWCRSKPKFPEPKGAKT